MSLRVGSLFSGIGGLELGLERAGMEVVWQVEKDPFCRKVLAKHWPDVFQRYEDVHDVGAHNLAPVDLICGGFPCQPVSVAGKQKGQDDERWLWPEFARIIRELRPRFALMENVPGLLVRGFGDVLGDLASIGYDAEWGCVSAAQVGAPHKRDRVFIIGTEQRGLVADPKGVEPPEPMRTRARWSRPSNRSVRTRDGNLADDWLTEPRVGRVVDGLPPEVDRLRALGNAVVPQVAEYIGQRILAMAVPSERADTTVEGESDG